MGIKKIDGEVLRGVPLYFRVGKKKGASTILNEG